MNGYEIQWKFYYSSEIDVFFFHPVSSFNLMAIRTAFLVVSLVRLLSSRLWGFPTVKLLLPGHLNVIYDSASFISLSFQYWLIVVCVVFFSTYFCPVDYRSNGHQVKARNRDLHLAGKTFRKYMLNEPSIWKLWNWDWKYDSFSFKM
jgi:hypothetical protein